MVTEDYDQQDCGFLQKKQKNDDPMSETSLEYHLFKSKKNRSNQEEEIDEETERQILY